MFKAQDFCRDHHITFWTVGKNCQEGFTQVQCPFCQDKSNHLGISELKGFTNCWICGHHTLADYVKTVLGVSYREAKEIIEVYISSAAHHLEGKKRGKKASTIELPTGTGPMTKLHREYLEKRDFDSYELEKLFDIQGTGHRGNYKFRLVMPVTYEGQLISYQCRDITGKSELRYKVCQKVNEVIDHKHCLYAYDEAIALGDSVVVVEGIFDVFRLGHGAVATFGTSWLPEQMMKLTKFNNIYILFDSEEAAQKKADSLGRELSLLGKNVEIITGLKTDPGDMSNDDAQALMIELGIRRK